MGSGLERLRLQTGSGVDPAVFTNRDQLQADGERLRREVEVQNALRKTLTDRIELFDSQRRVVKEWQSHGDALERHEEQVRQLIERSAGSARDLDELETHVNEQISRIEADQEVAVAALDAAKAQRLAAMSALQLLEGQHPACPTCARPFEDDQLDAALEVQRRSAQAATELAEATERRLDEINSSLQSALQLRLRSRA